MLLLLPPSETKREGGDPDRPLDLDSLSFPTLGVPRRRALSALLRLSRTSAAAAALKLGPTQGQEVERNRQLEVAPTMPALERFDGVLYDALDMATLSSAAREFARAHLAVASALFGLLAADDPIPAYRLSPDSRLPRLPLAPLWRAPVSAALSAQPGMILDLRSQGYVALGPAPTRPQSWVVNVVTEGADGRRKPLNHFNKKGKGEFTRAVLEAGIDHPDARSLLEWTASTGIQLEVGGDGQLTLVV